MNFKKYIGKTIINKRGYKWGKSYQTIYNNDTFTLIHYGTDILEVDLNTRKITHFYTCSFSDNNAINNCLVALRIHTILAGLGYAKVMRSELVISYNGLIIPYFKSEKFFDKYKKLNKSQKRLVRNLTKLNLNNKLKFINLFIDSEFDVFEKIFSKFIKHSNSIKNALDKYYKAYYSMPTSKLIKLNNKNSYVYLQSKYDKTTSMIYINDAKRELKYLGIHCQYIINWDIVIGRICLTKKLKAKDLGMARDIDFEILEDQEKRELLDVVGSKLDKDFVEWLRMEIAFSNL